MFGRAFRWVAASTRGGRGGERSDPRLATAVGRLDRFFEANGGSARIDPAVFAAPDVDPFEISNLLAQEHRLPLALDCLAAADDPADPARVHLARARHRLALAETDAARAHLAAAEAAADTPDRAGEAALLGVRLVEAEEGAETAIVRLAALDPPEPLVAAATHLRLSLLRNAPGREDEFEMEAAREYGRSRSFPVLKLLIDTAIARNKGVLVLPTLIALARVGGCPNVVFEDIVRLGWHLQDERLIAENLETIRAKAKISVTMARFAYERRDASSSLRDHVEHLRATIGAEPADPEINAQNARRWSGLARVAAAIGDPERALVWLERVVARFPFLFPERFYLAEALHATGDDRRCESLLDGLLEEGPQYMPLYPLAFRVKNRRPGAEPELEALLDRRARVIRRFRNRSETGPMPVYDAERFQLELRKGRIDAALACRTNRPANLYVRRLYPAACHRFSEDLLSGDRRYRRIGVIGWDGVSDEVRWARHFRDLRDSADSVIASCEPRFLSLFRRSFPWIEFHPIPRRMPHLWGARPIYRSAVQEQVFSGVVDAAYLDRLRECDLVLFSDEVTYQHRRYRSEAPMRVGGEAYVAADPERTRRWREDFRREAGGRPSVGLVWRSGLRFGDRTSHYVSLPELSPLLGADAHFVSLQHAPTAEELALCKAAGVKTLPGVDHFDDFEAVASVVSALDLVIGISTLPFEIAGAAGVEVWMLAVSPEGVYQRSGGGSCDVDQLTCNGRVIGYDPSLTDRPRSEIVEDVVRRATRRLAERLDGARSSPSETAG